MMKFLSWGLVCIGIVLLSLAALNGPEKKIHYYNNRTITNTPETKCNTQKSFIVISVSDGETSRAVAHIFGDDEKEMLRLAYEITDKLND